MGFEIKDEATFKAWAEEADQKLKGAVTIEQVKEITDGLNRDMEKMAADLGRRQLTVDDGQTKKRLPVTKEEFAQVGIKAILNLTTRAVANGDGTYSAESEDEDIAAYHQAHDYLKLLCETASGGRYKNDPKRFKFYHEVYMPAHAKVVAGLDTSTSGELSQFDPTEYSRSLYEKLRLSRMLPGLFPRVNVPRFPFVLPTMPADPTAYKWAENTAGGIGSSTSFGDGNTGNLSGSVTLSGASLALQLAWSWELDEDSIIPMLPFLEAAVINAIGNGIEQAILNGDTTSTHQDTDVTSSTDARKLWKGLRYHALSGSAKNSAAGKVNTDALWRDNVGLVRGLMGKYGVNAGDLALIASPIGVNQIRSCESFRTLYAFGSQATNTTGGSPRPNGGFSPDGFDLVVSEFQREDLAATGVNTAPSDNYTSMILVHKAMWLMAETRAIRTQVLNELFATYGQKGLVASWRGDFAPVFAPASNPHTGIVYAITTA